MTEILVTMIVLAIGFLGMASIQLLGAKNIAGSSYRAIATIYAYDMAERMRSNMGAVQGNAYDSSAKPAAPKCAASGCTAAQIAQRDTYEWNQLINADVTQGGLPKGVGRVQYNSATRQHEITVSWQDYIRAADGYDDQANYAPQEFVLAVRLLP